MYYRKGTITLNSIGAKNKYLVHTISQAKSSSVSLPEVHGIGKGLDPHVRPEKQKPMTPSADIRPPVYKPRIGRGRAGIQRRARMVIPSLPKQTLAPATVEKSMPEVITQPQVAAQTEHVSPVQTAFKQTLSPRIVTRQVPFYPNLLLRPPPRLPDVKENRRDLSDLDRHKH